MKHVLTILLLFVLISFNFSGFGLRKPLNRNISNADCVSSPWVFPANSLATDTCIITGLVFEVLENKSLKRLKANIRKGKIQIIGQDTKKYRIIRYVFSIRNNDEVSSVRHYGDMVAYPVIQILKESSVGESFYFEEIIVVNPSKEILTNAVKPIIIKRIK